MSTFVNFKIAISLSSIATMGETKWFLLAVNKTLIQIRIVRRLLTTSTTLGYFCVLKPRDQ